MRRVLTTLMILLAVLLAGLSALVLLVNPNDFREHLTRQVEARSGYQLRLDGPLRWHVWPQLSILSGRMSLTAPGAEQPVVRADNMRLDVALIPLLSHQLQVQQVMLKGGIVQLTPQTEAVRHENAPVPPRSNTLPQAEEDRGWALDVRRLKVEDSVLVLQRESDEQVIFRDINLQMEQNERHEATIDFSSRVNRNQRDLALSLTAQVDASDYPHQLKATVGQINWQLQGADLPSQGIVGQGSLGALWQDETQKLTLSNLNLNANGSQVTGQIGMTQQPVPEWVADLKFDRLDLDKLLNVPANPASSSARIQQGQSTSGQPRPVISNGDSLDGYDALLGNTAQISLTAQHLLWRGMDFSQVSARAQNQAGLLTLSELQGKLGEGDISLPGTVDARGKTVRTAFQPKLDNVEIGTILKAFNYPIALTGNLSLAGDFTGNRIDADAFRRDWQGEAHVELANLRSEGLNFQQLVHQAVERSTNVQTQQNYDSATRLDSFSSDLQLQKGKLTLSEMAGRSPLLTLTGEGSLDLVKQLSDMRFNVSVLEGWKGDSQLVAMLKTTAIPLRVYGPWQALNYSLQVDQSLRKQLRGEAKRRLQEWAENNKDDPDSKNIKQLLDKL
ncbi:AsmA protein [Enterobacter sp. BIGb0383]|uniref:outer membrane assembly protein AsmA n=1 Tax=unclassified Enterobacter TaxID=2608935 RepID=UPI000F4933C2|nr:MULTISPECIES: outer membrane assembly protein AsmA [unclassified Enterobacter]ROP62714.1 AsmA protein [Enterobacter sp. BIGb0383]ROS12875.1 AsmA protein [Enterobacter sp. BIGb0359]